jgi:hypothetical protein
MLHAIKRVLGIHTLYVILLLLLTKSAIFHALQALVSLHIIDHVGSPAFSEHNELCFECQTSTRSPFLMTPRICSACRKHLPVLSSFMTYHRV